MSLDEGKLRAYLDNELPGHEREQVEAALAASAETREALAGLRQEVARTGRYLAALEPTAASASTAGPALARLRAGLSNNAATSGKIEERIKAMFTSSFLKRHQAAVTMAVMLAAVAIAFSFAPVRVLAGDFLKIFRVQDVKFVPVDVGRLESNEELMALLEQVSPEIDVVVDGGPPQEVASLAEAAALVDFDVVEITSVPPDAGALNRVVVENRSVSQVHVDVDLAKAVFEAGGVEVDLPDSLRDTPIVVTRPTMVRQQWGTEHEPTLAFTQMRSPEIEYPDDVNLDELGVAGLQLLGMSEAEARAFGATIDWTNTLVLPVPKDKGIEVAEVSVNGAQGFLFRAEEDDESALMWQRDGLTYLLTGSYPAEQILQIGQSVQ